MCQQSKCDSNQWIIVPYLHFLINQESQQTVLCKYMLAKDKHYHINGELMCIRCSFHLEKHTHTHATTICLQLMWNENMLLLSKVCNLHNVQSKHKVVCAWCLRSFCSDFNSWHSFYCLSSAAVTKVRCLLKSSYLRVNPKAAI